ncbi:hypothetical protein ACHAW5_010671 [Stephanodiscus triporus]|uniref:Histidine--tRNA ligase, cytoplasmic n=1 Tax=Stephanodiscus triporus TaxID=2934178 RepID=A0ABD3QW29_9STRA
MVDARRLMSARVMDAISALTVERIGGGGTGMGGVGGGLDLDMYSLTRYDELRPHRGCVETASVIRACLSGTTRVAAGGGGGEADVVGGGGGGGRGGGGTTGTTMGTTTTTTTTTEDEEDATTTARSLAIRYASTIPQYHGPAREAILSSYRTIEVEANCSPMTVDEVMDPTIACIAVVSALTGILALRHGIDARTGGGPPAPAFAIDNTTDTTDAMGGGGGGGGGRKEEEEERDPPSPWGLSGLASELEKCVSGLRRSLEYEAKIGCEHVSSELARREGERMAKEAEKAARRAGKKKEDDDAPASSSSSCASASTAPLGGGGGGSSDATGAGGEGGGAEEGEGGKEKAAAVAVDEFAGMTEAQKAKVLKKRAEKEAKAAAKARAREEKASGGLAALSSVFGAGTALIYTLLSNSSSSSDGGDDGTAGLLSDPTLLAKLERTVDGLLSGGMQRKPKVPKGTRDYLPEQMSIRDEAFSIIRRVFKRHGAVEIDTPVFELKETLTGKYGEDSKLIYDLADQGGESLALRYDLTVPFARFLAVNAVGNIKRYHIGKVYRRDQPALSRGRYREFYQCDFDIAGSYGRMVPDSECLVVACEILDALPIGDFGIKLNHRRLLDAILDICGVPADKFRSICSAVDKLDKEPWGEVRREMVDEKGLAGDVADRIGEFVVLKGEPWEMYNSLMDAKKFGDHKGALDAMEDLRICFDYLDAMDKLRFISFDLSLARGLDYYTGVIYEAVCMNGNTQVGSIGGGGRYDNLVSMFQEAGKVTPCVGVSVGIELASAGENLMRERMKLAKVLWDANISAEFSQQENPKLKFEIANALDRQIPFMAIVGEEEAREGKCKVKDLKARTEETVDLSELVRTLRGKGVVPVGCEFAMNLY